MDTFIYIIYAYTFYGEGEKGSVQYSSKLAERPQAKEKSRNEVAKHIAQDTRTDNGIGTKT